MTAEIRADEAQQTANIDGAGEMEPVELQELPRLDDKIGGEDVSPQGVEAAPESAFMNGWRLYLLIFALCLSLLLSTLETTIVSTSLVSITNSLHGFEDRDWVVTSYLLTYTGFMVIYAKFSDIFGAKFMILLALLFFFVFSTACGLANGMTELIILRAFQGIGGSGIYSMVGVIVAAVVHPSKFAKYMAIISSIFAVSSILGPVLGGAINENSTWRWVFLLNPPAAGIASLIIIFVLPSSFSASEHTILTRLLRRFTRTAWARLDFLGAALMLVASILLVYALEEAGTRYPWKSAAIISPLVIAFLCWLLFVLYEILLEKKKRVQEPIFPMRLLKNRILAGMLLNAFFIGFPFTSIVVDIPQRFQAVNDASPTRAGLLLLPLLLLSPFASGLVGFLATKLKIPLVYIIVTGSCLQFIGVGLMCSLSDTSLVEQKKQYGFEILMGLGFGFVLTGLLGFIPLVVSKKNMPVIIGAVTQVRVLGGTVGLAISTTTLNSFVQNRLVQMLSAEQIVAIGNSLTEINSLTIEQQLFVRRVFAEGYGRQMWVLLGFSGMVVLSSLLMWEKKPRRHVTEGMMIMENEASV